jgi:transposase-like protein
MPGSPPPPRIPLPKNWPDRVRSAVIHAISLAHFSLTSTRSWAANNWNARIRLKAENDRLRQELALIREEMRIKDSRMLRIPAQRRPHYPPTERLSILELRAARAWSLSQTARHLLITTATVASWMGRLDEDGSRALVQIRVPVNKFPELVTYMVQRLKVLCPTLGRVKAGQILSRAGLHIGATTIDWRGKEPPRRNPSPVAESSRPAVRSNRPDHMI